MSQHFLFLLSPNFFQHLQKHVSSCFSEPVSSIITSNVPKIQSAKQLAFVGPKLGDKGLQDAVPSAVPAVRPVTKQKVKKVAAPKKVKPVCEALMWYGDVYPAKTFEFLLASQIGQTIYKHLKAAVKPSYDSEEIPDYFIEMTSTLGKLNDVSLYATLFFRLQFI